MTGALAAAPAHASLTVNLQVPGGGTTMLIGGDQTNTTVPVQVWATVTGTGTISPNPTPGTSGTAPAVTAGDFDGLQYLYYNILNSNSTGTLISGGVSSVVLNSTLGFNANGSQLGAIQNVSNGISVGSTTAVTSIAKPRSAAAVFDNFATYNQSAPAASAYREYGNDGTNIKVSGSSVSFLVETVNFKPSAFGQRNKITFSVGIPSATFITANSIYAPANWFEDTTTQKDPTTGQPMPLAGNKDASPVAGTQAVIQDTIAGDTNLDGTVDGADLGNLASFFGKTSGATFAQGDFNSDGKVDGADLGDLATNFGLSVGSITPSTSVGTFAEALAKVEAANRGLPPRSARSSCQSRRPCPWRQWPASPSSAAADADPIGWAVNPAVIRRSLTHLANRPSGELTMRSHPKSKSLKILAVAATPALAALLPVSAAHANPTVTLTDLGTASDNAGDTATAYEGYLLTVVADTGDVVTAITGGQTTTSTNGVFGSFLQDFTPAKSGSTSTPALAGTVGSANGLDTHFLTLTRSDVTPPFEDSNNTNPGNTVPANDTFDAYGTGTYLRGVFGLPASAQTGNLQLAYLVLPKSGTTVTANLLVAEAVSGGSSTNFPVLQAFTTGATPTPTPTATPLISLTTTAPTAFGTQQGTLNLVGGNTKYSTATATFANAVNTGYVAVNGFNPGTDTEIYGLAVTGSAADLQTLVNDINATGGNTDTNGTVVASLRTAASNAALTGLPAADDIILTTSGTTSGSPFLGLNFTTVTGATGALTVSSISAVPEPTTLTALAVGSVGLLAGRRRRNRGL